MSKLKIFVFFSVAFFLFGCGPEIESEQIVSTYENGQPKVKRVYPNPTDTTEYVQLVYLEDGRLKDSVLFVDNRYQGERKVYEYEEQKIYIVTYVDGIKLGLTKCFYESGNLYYTGWFENGTRSGPFLFYEEDGTLFQYDYYTNNGEVVYRREYDSNGKYKESEGWALIQYRFDDDTARLGEDFPIEIDLAVPDGCTSSIDGVSTKRRQNISESYGSTGPGVKTITYYYHGTEEGNDTAYFKWSVLEISSSLRDTGTVAIPLIIAAESK